MIPQHGRSRCSFVVSCACLVLWSSLAQAQSASPPYPVKPVRVIVPYPPGSGVDIVTRIVAPRLAEGTGQSFVVDNRPGAGGRVGTQFAARAPADGYHLLAGGTSFTVSPVLSADPGFSQRDFVPISRLASVPFILVVHPTMPVKTIADLVALARTKPGAINYASTGVGTSPHLSTELFQREARITLTHVPYKGSGPALADLVGGHVDMFFCNMLSATPHVASGKLRPLAVTSLQRSPVTPHVPTVSESGYRDFETVTWFGLLAPAGVPEHAVTKLHAEIVKVLRRSDVQSELASQGGAVTIDKGPEEMARYIQSQTAKWSRVIKAAGITAQ